MAKHEAAPLAPPVETGEPCGLVATIIETRSLADEIAFRLEAAILARELPPGSKLLQEELCQRFGVSRTPVREALRKLQALRLVVMVPNRGATVRLPTRKDVAEVYDLRAELEAFAAELACERAGPSLDAELARAAEGLKRRKNARAGRAITDTAFNIELAAAIRHFHHVIQDAAGNERLVIVLHELEASFPGDYCSHEMSRPAEGDRLHIDDHDRIREAIRRRDAAAARRLMQEHVLRAKAMLLRHFDEQGLWPGP